MPLQGSCSRRTSTRSLEGLFARFIRTGFKASTTSNISNIGNFSLLIFHHSLVWS